MEKFMRTSCMVCGGELEEKGNNVYRCKHCGEQFKLRDVESYAQAIRASVREEVTEALLAQRNKDIANARRNLYNELKAEHISSTKVIEWCHRIKEYLPDDTQAVVFEVLNSGDKKQINKSLDGIDAKGAGGYYVKDILDFMLKSLTSDNVLSLKSLADRALNGSEKTDYLNRIEEEAAKYDQGIYNPTVPRDAFIAYSSADMSRVNKVVNELRSAGIRCFVALDNIRHGRGAAENYNEILQTAMNNCKCFVFMSSRNSRRFDCDAMEVELKYVRENNLKVKKIEYILDDYSADESSGVKSILKKFFGPSEFCRDVSDLAKRIFSADEKSEKKPLKEISLSTDTNTNTQDELPAFASRKVSRLYKKAIKGNVKAQTGLGDCYYNGEGVGQSYAEAVKWYRKAAEQGNAAAQYNLGVCYSFGEGVEQSHAEAVKWYRKAAEQGDADAQNNLGVCYEYGQGVAKKLTEAAIYYKASAKKGNEKGCENLSRCYKHGIGVEQNDKLTKKWSKRYKKINRIGISSYILLCSALLTATISELLYVFCLAFKTNYIDAPVSIAFIFFCSLTVILFVVTLILTIAHWSMVGWRIKGEKYKLFLLVEIIILLCVIAVFSAIDGLTFVPSSSVAYGVDENVVLTCEYVDDSATELTIPNEVDD